MEAKKASDWVTVVTRSRLFITTLLAAVADHSSQLPVQMDACATFEEIPFKRQR